MLKNFWKDTKGTAAVEFSLTIVIFVTLLFMFFELMRISLTSAYMDLAIAESSRLARVDSYNHDYTRGDFDYAKAFETRLKSANAIWYGAVGFSDSANKLKVDVDYAESPSDIISGNYRAKVDSKGNPIVNSQGAILAKYTVDYDYTSWIPLIPNLITQPLFHREFVVVQEYERSK